MIKENCELLARTIVEKGVEDWRALCKSECATCGNINYIYDDNSGKYFCMSCGKIARKQPHVMRQTKLVSFKELAEFFTDGTADGYLATTNISGKKIYAQLRKEKRSAEKRLQKLIV